jgi:alpha-glucosidase
MHSLYREALHLRRDQHGESFAWLPSAPSVLAFRREDGLGCVVNFGPGPAALPAGSTVLLASGPLEGDSLPADTSVWVRLP